MENAAKKNLQFKAQKEVDLWITLIRELKTSAFTAEKAVQFADVIVLAYRDRMKARRKELEEKDEDLWREIVSDVDKKFDDFQKEPQKDEEPQRV